MSIACIKCGIENVDDALFCVHCGAKSELEANADTNKLETPNKKDRIAIVVSVIYFIFILTVYENKVEMHLRLFSTLIPLSLYWGYRFIKNDISFMQQVGGSKKNF